MPSVNRFTFSDVIECIAEGTLIGDRHSAFEHIIYDSRLIIAPETSIFLALTGFSGRDGHLFIQHAYEQGIRLFWVSEPAHLPADCHGIVVPDVLASLQQFAKSHRQRFSNPVVGITGSNGKTIVKEWLSTLLQPTHKLWRSPRSFNSQLGVALSLLGIHPSHDLAIIEAGISCAGEMARLSDMIRPTFGIMTHFGDAHAEGFENELVKLKEKLSLFRGCQWLLLSSDDYTVLSAAKNQLNCPLITIGQALNADAFLTIHTKTDSQQVFSIAYLGETVTFTLDIPGQAALENVCLALMAARLIKGNWQNLVENVRLLGPVSMRTEWLTDNPEITIINDSYTADMASVTNAFSLLSQDQTRPEKVLILSDLDHHHHEAPSIHTQIIQYAKRLFPHSPIHLIGEQFANSAPKNDKYIKFYADVDNFIKHFNYLDFINKTVLLKGSRLFRLEKIIPYLSRQANVSYFKINLGNLKHNLEVFRAHLPWSVRIMAMVKASAYGSGIVQIATTLAREGIDYFGVAYPNEGVQLRQSGIRTPIMVMNADRVSFPQLVAFNLEPAIWSVKMLTEFLSLPGEKPAIHLELDTGMARLGLTEKDIAEIIRILKSTPGLKVASVFTHLSSADDSKDDAFTRQQINILQTFAELVQQIHPTCYVHALNTAGVMRFKAEKLNFNMVRVGIGLYGIAPVANWTPLLKEIGSLHTIISQIHDYPAGAGVSYNRQAILARPSKIATLPIGYGDGVPRRLGGGKLNVLIKGQFFPVIGRICMDMMMVDITDSTEPLYEGDEVTIFGEGQSVNLVAQAAETIPYEILSGIPARVRRVYIRE